MDPITAAIIVGVAAGATKVGEQAIVDAYAKLKELLKRKFGSKSKVIEAVRELETNPKSSARKDVLNEEVTAVKAKHDKELLKAAQSLLKIIKSKPNGEQIIQMAIGDQNVQINGSGNVVKVNTSKTK